MIDLDNKDILVIGLGGRGQAACELLRQNGARVVAIDSADTPVLRDAAERLHPVGVEVLLGVSKLPARRFDLAVLSPAVPTNHPIVLAAADQKIAITGELEVGFQEAKCLCIAIAGT